MVAISSGMGLAEVVVLLEEVNIIKEEEDSVMIMGIFDPSLDMHEWIAADEADPVSVSASSDIII
jgi:hypothetical protein